MEEWLWERLLDFVDVLLENALINKQTARILF